MNTATALAALAEDRQPVWWLPIETLGADLAEMEHRLRNASGPEPVAAMAGELFSAGGKRLRALAALVVARRFGISSGRAVGLATAVELTHGATLLHDDVIDEADQRRGTVAARRRWSNTLSILGGDYLLVRALQAVAEFGSGALRAAHLRTLDALVSAEVAQQVAQREIDVSTHGYVGVARGKTGALFAFACAGPALLATEPAAAAGLERFGSELGVAFQIADDLRDLLRRDPSKDQNLDLEDGILTLPIRIAARVDGSVYRAICDARDRRLTKEEVADLACRVRKTGAVKEAVAIARRHLAEAREALVAVVRQEGLEPLGRVCTWLVDELGTMEGAA